MRDLNLGPPEAQWAVLTSLSVVNLFSVADLCRAVHAGVTAGD